MSNPKITPDFPGAYSGLADQWEKGMRSQIKMLPRYEGYRPSLAALGEKPPDTIEAEAQEVPEEERARHGRFYIGVREGNTITPRKLANSLGRNPRHQVEHASRVRLRMDCGPCG